MNEVLASSELDLDGCGEIFDLASRRDPQSAVHLSERFSGSGELRTGGSPISQHGPRGLMLFHGHLEPASSQRSF